MKKERVISLTAICGSIIISSVILGLLLRGPRYQIQHFGGLLTVVTDTWTGKIYYTAVGTNEAPTYWEEFLLPPDKGYAPHLNDDDAE